MKEDYSLLDLNFYVEKGNIVKRDYTKESFKEFMDRHEIEYACHIIPSAKIVRIIKEEEPTKEELVKIREYASSIIDEEDLHMELAVQMHKHFKIYKTIRKI